MTTHEMAEGHLAQASEILPEAERAYQRGVWNLAVRGAPSNGRPEKGGDVGSLATPV